MYSNAQKYGIGADQLDSAMGWNAGTSNNWIQQNGLNPLGGAQQGMGLPQVGFCLRTHIQELTAIARSTATLRTQRKAATTNRTRL